MLIDAFLVKRARSSKKDLIDPDERSWQRMCYNTISKGILSDSEQGIASWGKHTIMLLSHQLKLLFSSRTTDRGFFTVRASVTFVLIYDVVHLVEAAKRGQAKTKDLFLGHLPLIAMDMISLSRFNEAYWLLLLVSRQYVLRDKSDPENRLLLTPYALAAELLRLTGGTSVPSILGTDAIAKEVPALFRAWDDSAAVDSALRGLARLREKEFTKYLQDKDSIYGDSVYGYLPVEFLAIYTVRKRLGLSTPEIDHPWICKHRFFAISEGTVPIPEEPGLNLIKNAFNLDIYLEADIKRLEAMPDTLLTELSGPVVIESSSHCDTTPNDTLAQLYMSQFIGDLETAIADSAFEVRWKDSGVSALMLALEQLPGDCYSVEESEDELFAELTLFGRSSRMKLRTSKKQTEASIVPGQSLIARLNKLLQPEYEICMLTISQGDSDVLYLLKPKPWFDALRAANPKQFKKVFVTPKP